jgi:hypothetical protein
LLSFSNPKSKGIKSLELRARSDDGSASARVSFAHSTESIAASLSGENEELIASLTSDLRDILEATTPWYSWISCIDLGYVFIGSFFFLWLVGSLTLGEPRTPRQGVGLGSAVLLALVAVAFILGLAFLGWVMHRLHSRYFPLSQFALGQGSERFETDERIRWVVIIGFVISVFASLVVAFATSG